MIELKGTTWGHTRGFAPLAALGRVWEDFHPEERVTWSNRSLWSFGEEPLSAFLDQFDLIVFDYPFAGEAIERGWVAPLESLIDPTELAACRAGAVGPLYDAFTFHGRQAALPLDVATHAAVARPDLLERLGEERPHDLAATIDLARRTGKVAMPMRPTGVWGAFLSLLSNAGDAPFRRPDGEAFDRDMALSLCDGLAELARLVDPSCLEAYPVALLNRMTQDDDIAYMPFTYGYCTYGIEGYGRHRLAFLPIAGGQGHGRGAILGGAGIGMSSASRHPALAARHLAWLASAAIQSTLYASFGGQPAQRAAWLDPANDARAHGFFASLLDSAEHPYVRPNLPGFHDFQNASAGRLQAAVASGRAIGDAIDAISAGWRRLSGSGRGS